MLLASDITQFLEIDLSFGAATLNAIRRAQIAKKEENVEEINSWMQLSCRRGISFSSCAFITPEGTLGRRICIARIVLNYNDIK